MRAGHARGRHAAQPGPSNRHVGGLLRTAGLAALATAFLAVAVANDRPPLQPAAATSPDTSQAVQDRAGVDRVSRSADRPQIAPERPGPSVQKIVRKRETTLQLASRRSSAYAQVLASDLWVMPTTGFAISTWFGDAGSYWSSGYHTGIDMSAPLGTPVVAVANGVVVQAGWDGPYGNQVRLQLANGDEVWFNHMSSIAVAAGQAVAQGQSVGAVGDTGNSYGSHLHFEYRLASDLSTAVDPVPFMHEHGLTM